MKTVLIVTSLVLFTMNITTDIILLINEFKKGE